jgi:hypothetical protein
MDVRLKLMSLKNISALALGLLAGCEAASVSTKVAVDLINSPPTISSASYTLDEGDSVSVVLDSDDVDDNILTYTIVEEPRYGTFTGTPPNMTYTPKSYFYGSDEIKLKVSDGEFESDVATIAITVEAVNPIFYLSPSGSDFTGTINDATKPYQSAQGVYVAANTYQALNGGTVHIQVASGDYVGIVLTMDWNSNVIVHSDRLDPANLGGIWANGVSGSTATDLGNNGLIVSFTGWDIHVGNISSQGAPISTTFYTGGDGGAVTLTGMNLIAGAIAVTGGGISSPVGAWSPGNGGSVTLNSGVTSGEIYASGGTGGILPGGVTYRRGNGGTVTINSGATAATIISEGGYTSTGTAGAGGSVTVRGNSGAIWVRGGASFTGSVGTGAAGGTVIVRSTGVSGAIYTMGGSGVLASGAGGTILVEGTAAALNASGGSSLTSAGAGNPGGAGGAITVGVTPNGETGVTGAIISNGGTGGAASAGAAGGIGGAAGDVTVHSGAQVGSVTLMGGTGGAGNGAGAQGNGGAGGDLTVTLPAVYGDAVLTGGAGSISGTTGVLTEN